MSADLKQDILNAVAGVGLQKSTNKCQHKWVFQEAKKKTTLSSNNGNWVAHFHRIDVYYCENCCEIKNIEKKESIRLPFGGSRHAEDFAPIWY